MFDNRPVVRAVVACAITLLLFSGGIYGVFSGEKTEYEYTVKAEQVNGDRMVNDTVSYDTLSEPEKDLLYDAFKRSDHFLGGAEAEMHRDEQIDVNEEWRVVEIQGVPMLVAIQEDSYQTLTAMGLLASFSLAFTFFSLFVTIPIVENAVKQVRNKQS